MTVIGGSDTYSNYTCDECDGSADQQYVSNKWVAGIWSQVGASRQ